MYSITTTTTTNNNNNIDNNNATHNRLLCFGFRRLSSGERKPFISRTLLGWLETMLAQFTSNYIDIA